MPRATQPGAPAIARVQRSSTVDLITTELRNAIYEGLIMPGTAIHEIAIARQLGVSRGSLRESAQRLVQEGLLISSPGQGLRVAVVDESGLQELYRTRAIIEGAATLELASIEGAAERQRRLAPAVAALDRLQRLAEAYDGEHQTRAIGDADLDFHFATVQAAGNLRLAKAMSTLVIETRLASLGNPRGFIIRTDVHRPHRERIERILAGDGTGAVELLERHFRDTVDRLSGVLAQQVETATVRIDEDTYILGPITG